MMSVKSEMLGARDEFISLVRNELLGPGSEVSVPDAEHELITTSPEKRYSIGILFPQGNRVKADNGDVDRDSNEDEAADDFEMSDEETVAEPEDNVERKADITEKQDKSDDADDDPDSEDNLDEEVSLAAQNMPSSFGISFFVKGDTDAVRMSVKYGTYRKARLTDCRIPFVPARPDGWVVPEEISSYIVYDNSEKCLKMCRGFNRGEVRKLKERDLLDTDDDHIIDNMYKLADQLKRGHVREPHEYHDIVIRFGNSDYVECAENLDSDLVGITALRREMENGSTSLTIMLVNKRTGYATGENCVFQPELKIDTSDNKFKFIEYAGTADFNILDEEEKSLELQYRNKHVYGTGLGTAVNWNINEKGEGVIRNDFFPEAEVPSMDFNLPENCGVDKRTLSMKYLSDLDDTGKELKIRDLTSLVSSYSAWIDGLCKRIGNLENRFKAVAERNLEGCRAACERMRNGVAILESNDRAWSAFQLANRAMFMQRVQLVIQRKWPSTFPDEKELSGVLKSLDYRTADTEFPEDRYAWRPFQLAFMLLDVASVTSEESRDRSVVDLIWFPTGGGKTEAYLGLTAMTIFYRRLRYPKESAGTSVIMRYTLRLLAAQQFTRASTLICACEVIRKDCCAKNPRYPVYALGKTPITIGLWIGGDHTPNESKKAKIHLEKLTSATENSLGYAKETHNKFQVLKCPWCGTRMVRETDSKGKIRGEFGYRMRGGNRFELFCTRQSCQFGAGLPVQVVDDELYRDPPTLLFGTVDKFAMLPWNERIGNFFALGNDNRAPELIIQDELHLISGPLGTMVGLYESAVDALCRRKGNVTKIVASTATIRHAVEQCAALYDRDVSQFPAPALDAEDSFFARESKIDYGHEVFGRKYVGLMPSGKTKAMMEIRAMAAMLQKAKDMDLPDEVRDKFWTLTAYYNSLKDLGKAATMVDDDVKDFMKRMCYRLRSSAEVRSIGTADELTSRVTTTQLNHTLDKLEKVCYSTEHIKNRMPPYPCNVLLATNMISVGIDVARLNVMLIVGQPKLTSEYIQASSRVGREYPGVAFVMYDGGKSRDRSHYEQFRSYHESFYRHVEPTGATPFSGPSRKRALHAVLIAYIRLSEKLLCGENDAVKFRCEEYGETVNKICDFIAERCADINRRINPYMEDDSETIRSEMKEMLKKWEELAQEAEEGFCYGKKFMLKGPDGPGQRLMKTFGTFRDDPAFETMTSMRNVDVMVPGSVINWKEGK